MSNKGSYLNHSYKYSMPVGLINKFINNNNRELIEHFQNLKALYNFKKNIQCTNTHNYTNQ